MIVTCNPEEQTFLLRIGAHETDLVKQVPGTSWNEPLGAWTCRATWPAYVAICGVFAHNLQAEPSFADWGAQAWTARYGPLVSLRFMEDYAALTGPTAERLWPLQRVAVMAMVFAERYLEMDEMGGGKTRTTLAALKLAAAQHGPEQVFPALVVCPNKVRRTWRKEAIEDLRRPSGAVEPAFWPELRIEVMPKGKPAQRKLLERVKAGEVDVVATNWESLAGLSRLEAFGNIELKPNERTPNLLNEIAWGTVIADEAHRAKDRRAKQTRALKAIAFGTPSVGTAPTRFRWALTGTPVSSNSAEAWSILNFIDDIAWPAYSRMVDRYATTIWTQYGSMEIGGVKPETREEFYAAFDPFGIRRLRVQFDPFKPKVVGLVQTVPMEAKQAKAYADMAKSMIAEMDNGTVLAATDKLHRGNRLDQLAQAYGEMVDKGRRHAETGETILDLQLRAPSNKVRAMLDLCEEIGVTKSGHSGRAIVFGSPSRQLIALCEEALKKEKIPYTLIAGGMNDREQEQQEHAFETGATNVALCVISAAKEGLNSLIRADTLVFLQRSWDRVENEQFFARIDRPGQQAGSVTCIDIVSEGTLEDFFATDEGASKTEKLDAKYRNFQEVVADDRILRTMLTFKGEQ